MPIGNFDHICMFLASRPRYKLLVCRENPCVGITPLNLGYAISAKVASLQDRTALSYIAPSIVDEVINETTTHIEDIGEVVVIDNAGILFESELAPLEENEKLSKTLIFNRNQGFFFLVTMEK